MPRDAPAASEATREEVQRSVNQCPASSRSQVLSEGCDDQRTSAGIPLSLSLSLHDDDDRHERGGRRCIEATKKNLLPMEKRETACEMRQKN